MNKMIPPDQIASNIRMMLDSDVRHYRNFGVYWYFVKAFLKKYYTQDNLHLLGDFEQADVVADQFVVVAARGGGGCGPHAARPPAPSPHDGRAAGVLAAFTLSGRDPRGCRSPDCVARDGAPRPWDCPSGRRSTAVTVAACGISGMAHFPN